MGHIPPRGMSQPRAGEGNRGRSEATVTPGQNAASGITSSGAIAKRWGLGRGDTNEVLYRSHCNQHPYSPALVFLVSAGLWLGTCWDKAPGWAGGAGKRREPQPQPREETGSLENPDSK